MPLPSTLTTAAQHQDFDLKVVAGSWPDDIAGDMVFSTPQNSPTCPTPSSTGAPSAGCP